LSDQRRRNAGGGAESDHDKRMGAPGYQQNEADKRDAKIPGRMDRRGPDWIVERSPGETSQ
jgi:hypothetical protein